MPKKTTAPAGETAMPKGPIEGARLINIPRGDKTYPAAVYVGDLPKTGAKLKFKLDNGVTYAGTVHDATEMDGEIICEFSEGLEPVATK